MKDYAFILKGLDCEHCAAKLQRKIAELEGVEHVSVSYPSCMCTFEAEEASLEAVFALIHAEEEEVEIVPAEECSCHYEHHHEEACSCHHEHHHHHDEEEETATYLFEVKGIDCADCAAKLEEKITKLEGISNVSLSFLNESLRYDCDHDEGKEMEEKVRALIAKEEPDAVVTAKGHKHHEHHHEECSCHHEHHHHHHDEEEETATYLFEVKGIDCADCAAKLEEKIAKLEGISNVSLSFMNESLRYDCDHDEGKEMEEKVRALIAKEEPDAVLTAKGHKHHEHDHHHHEEHAAAVTANTRCYSIKGLDCADCAAKLEGKLAKINGISNVSISFLNSSLRYDCSDIDLERIEQEVRTVTAKEEPEAVIEKAAAGKIYKFRIAGIDCADCAAKLARKAAAIEGVSGADAEFISETLTVTCAPKDKAAVEEKLRAMIAREEPEVVVSEITEKQKTLPDEEEDDKTMLMRLAAGALLFIIGFFLKGSLQTAAMIISYLILGYDVLFKAVRNIGRGQVFDEHFLMSVATLAAMWLQDYREAAGVMLFYQIGEYFQDRAVRSSRRSIAGLMDLRGEHAWVLRDGQFADASPEEVMPGEIIRIRPGERIPLDGIIVNGSTSIDTSSLTGESALRDVDTGDEVYSGTVNQNGVIEVRVTKEYGDSTVSRILELVENSDSNKASHERFITKFSRWYTPAVVIAAVITAIVVALITKDVRTGIERACTFLVISCPCALVISIPLSFFAGIGGLSSQGVLVKGANVVEALANISQVVMDKTGTLTSGTFALDQILSADDPETLKRSAAYAEFHSNHPIAQAVKKAWTEPVDETQIHDVREIPGRGVQVTVNGSTILAGNYKLMAENGITCKEENVPGTLVYASKDGTYLGCMVFRDQLKEDAKKTVDELHAAGKKCVIVSGDNRRIAEEAGKALGADQVFAECMPQDKVDTLRRLKENGSAAFVGDGVNDAPVLALADVGIAMGGLGSDAAIEAADVVIMDDRPSRTALAIRASKRILNVASQNIKGAIFIKIATLILGAFGYANMWMAIFADTGVAMLCVLNALRLLKVRN